MFEDKTHKALLEKMKTAFTGDINTGEGSFVESVLSPAALELVQAYMNMEQVIKEAFPQTASFSALKLKAAEYGLDEKEGESQESLLERLLLKMQKPSTSGNKNDYLNWALSVEGVGAAKVFPLERGAGTVNVAVIGMDKKAVDQTLLDTVKEEIELVRPVGADVQVLSGVDRQIDVTVDIHKQSGHDILVIQSLIENVIRSYLRLIAFDIDYVSAGQIGKLLLDVEGVLDYDGLMLNGSKSNFALGAYETPVLGTVTVNES